VRVDGTAILEFHAQEATEPFVEEQVSHKEDATSAEVGRVQEETVAIIIHDIGFAREFCSWVTT